MNKQQLVDAIAKQAKINKAQAKAALDATLEAIKDALKRGQKVQLVGFGTFQVAQRKARQGRNPRTGQPIRIPARKVVRFRPSSELKKI